MLNASCVAALLAIAAPALGQDPTERANQVKATYIYHTGRYVTWPKNVFPKADSPFIVGVVGNSSIHRYLTAIAEKKTVHDRPLVIKNPSKDAWKNCQILFVDSSVDQEQRQEILQAVKDQPVLLMGESETFLDAGGHIYFAIVENRVRLRIALEPAQKKGFQFSSQLLRVADIVKPE